MGPTLHVFFSYAVITLLTGLVAGTTTTDIVPTLVLSNPLTGYDGQFYAVSATIGFPGWNFMLTFDPTISGIVVAHEQFVGSNRTNRFDPGHSSTFRSARNLSDRMIGSDGVNTASNEGKLEVTVMLSDDPTDTAVEAFFSQLFDGLFYDDQTYATVYTFAFRKTCRAGAAENAGSITYNAADGELCGELGAPTQPLPSCKVPLLNVEIAVSDSGARIPFRALVLPVSDIILPPKLFHDLQVILQAKLEGDKYVVECNASFDKLTFMVDDVAYPLEFAFLVDKFGDCCICGPSGVLSVGLSGVLSVGLSDGLSQVASVFHPLPCDTSPTFVLLSHTT